MYLPFIAALFAGFHIFSLKLLTFDKYNFYITLTFVIITMILSRYFIYKSMDTVSNPTIVHLILNLSVFVTFFASLLLFNLKDFRIDFFIFGIILFISGGLCINYSYKIKN